MQLLVLCLGISEEGGIAPTPTVRGFGSGNKARGSVGGVSVVGVALGVINSHGGRLISQVDPEDLEVRTIALAIPLCSNREERRSLFLEICGKAIEREAIAEAVDPVPLSFSLVGFLTDGEEKDKFGEGEIQAQRWWGGWTEID